MSDAEWRKTKDGLPSEGTWCWVYRAGVETGTPLVPYPPGPFIACYSAKAAGGWTDENTWEDWEGAVTHYQVIPEPEPPTQADEEMP